MLQRHVLADGQVLYFLTDDLPPEAGGGFHAMVTTRSTVIASEAFQAANDAADWLKREQEERLAGHDCGTGCMRLAPKA